MSTEENKAIVRRLFDEVEHRQTGLKIEELLLTGLCRRLSALLPSAHRPIGHQRKWCGAPGPPFLITTRSWKIVAEGDKVVARFLITGTQQGHWGPIPPTGKKLSFEKSLFFVSSTGRWWDSEALWIISTRYDNQIGFHTPAGTDGRKQFVERHPNFRST